jgi:DNA topoisomerase-1
MKEIKQFVLQNEDLGREYYHARLFKTKSKSAQEAHEAIRPTHIDCLALDDSFEDSAKRIYEMIWKRTVASQMSPYVYDQMTITIGIQDNDKKFIAKAEQMIFDGYKKIYDDISKKEDEENDEVFSVFTGDIHRGDLLRNEKVVSTEKYQSPPARFAEATIIKKMEVVGIGRPSTYANILDTLFERTYIEKKNIPAKKYKGQNFILEKNKIKQQNIDIPVGGEKNKLVPTELGKQTNGFLGEHFENIMNTEFTSHMENKLDLIAQGHEVWNSTVQEYYQSFHPKVAELQEQGSSLRPALQKRLLGIHEDKNIYVYNARYGPVYQIGEDNDKGKKYMKLKETDTVDGVTLEDYIQTKLVPEYPKVVGRYEEKEIMLKKGKFGFYLTYQEINFKIKEGMTPEELTEEEAIQCILPTQNTNTTEETKIVPPRKCGKYKIAVGQYGPYVQLDSIFASIPNTMNMETITEEECKTLIENRKNYMKTQGKKTTKKKN